MKKIFLAAVLVLSAFTLQAQVGQGKFLAGGSFSLDFGTERNTFQNNNTTVTTERSYREIIFNPRIGYFLTENLALGLGFDISSRSSERANGNVENDFTSTGVGVFARYYFPANIFGEGYIGYLSQRAGAGNGQENYTGLGYSVGVGYAYFLSNSVALEPMVKFAGYSTSWTEDERFKRSRAGVIFGIGLQVYL